MRPALGISQVLLVSATVLGVSSILEGAEPKLSESVARWREGMNLAWAGKPNAARALLLELHRQDPDDVCGCYFPAMIDIDWELDGSESATDPERGRLLLDRAIEVGKKRVEAQPDDAAAAYCLGAAYGTRAAFRFGHGEQFSGAFDAKKARALMLSLLEDDPSCEDCRFWTGTYDYMGATLPKFFKFLKTLLFFPAGHRERGLELLEGAAKKGELERYHACYILHVAYREIEHDWTKDKNVLERWRAAYPESPDVALMLAQVLANSGRRGRSRSILLLREILDHVKAGKIEDERETSAAVGLAKLLVDDLEPEAAVEALRPVVARKQGREREELALSRVLGRALNRAGLHSEAVAMLQDLKTRYPGDSDLTEIGFEVAQLGEEDSKIYKATLPGRRLLRDHKFTESEAALVGLKKEHDDHPQIEYLIGLTNFEAKRDGLAEQSFRKVIDVRDTQPTFVLPQSYLLLGNLRDVAGDRHGAKELYRFAIKTAAGDDGVRRTAEYYLKNQYKR